MANAVLILLLCQLAGESVQRWLALPIPGPVIGIALLFLSFLAIRPPFPALETVSNGLVAHLALMFIPAGVGVMVYWDTIQREWIGLSAVLLVSTTLALLAAGWTFQALRRRMSLRPEAEEEAGG